MTATCTPRSGVVLIACALACAGAGRPMVIPTPSAAAIVHLFSLRMGLSSQDHARPARERRLMTFRPRPNHPYAAAPRLWGISALEDQATAGALMWVPGSIAFLLPAMLIIVEQLSGARDGRAVAAPAARARRLSRRPQL